MGLYLNQNDQRSQLQAKVEDELQERLRAKQGAPGKTPNQPAILDNYQQTSKYAWVWIALLCLAVIALGWVIVA